jgi:hypothetical protein
MTLIRWPFRFFNRLRKQERAVECVSQSYGSRNIALQVRHNACDSYSGIGTTGNNAPNNQANSDYPIQVGEARNMLKIGNGDGNRGHLNVLGAQVNSSGIQAIDNLAQRASPSLKARFGHLCRAFVNAWGAR